MRAAVDGVDVVGKAEERLRVAVVVLQGDFDVNGAVAGRAGFLALHVDRRVMEDSLAAVEMFDKFRDAAVVKKIGCLIGIFALINECDLEAFVEESEFAETLGKSVEVKLRHRHDGGVGFESDLRAVLAACFAGRGETAFGNAAFVVLFPRERVGRRFFGRAPDLQMQLFGKRIHAAHADAMQTARNLVAVGIELAARVQFGHNNLGRRDAFLVHIDRDAAAVVDDRNRVVDVNRYVDLGTVACQSFVDRVVDNFIHEVMQTDFTGRTDVHCRPEPYCFESLKNLNG